MPYINEHAVRLEPPSKYERFRRENDKFGSGIDAIWGITEDGKAELQALRFDAKRYSIEAVRNWLREHGYEPLEIEPATGEFSEDAIEREALLMEAGDYPDKGITITEESLHQMAQSGAGAPVIVEHKPTLVLGWIRELWRKGKQLWGKLALKPHANQLIEESAVKGLSVGVRRNPDGTLSLHEVSLTTSPRVPSAQLFSDAPSLYIACADESAQVTTMADEIRKDGTEMDALRMALERERERSAALETRVQEFEQRLQLAQRELTRAAAERIVEGWQRAGKLPPAAARHAHALLMSLAGEHGAALVEFSTHGNRESLPAAVQHFMSLVESLPETRVQPAARYASLDDAALAERKAQLAEELRKKGFTFAQNGVSDELMQLIGNLEVRE